MVEDNGEVVWDGMTRGKAVGAKRLDGGIGRVDEVASRCEIGGLSSDDNGTYIYGEDRFEGNRSIEVLSILLHHRDNMLEPSGLWCTSLIDEAKELEHVSEPRLVCSVQNTSEALEGRIPKVTSRIKLSLGGEK